MPKCNLLVSFYAPSGMKKISMDLADSEGIMPTGDP